MRFPLLKKSGPSPMVVGLVIRATTVLFIEIAICLGRLPCRKGGGIAARELVGIPDRVLGVN